MTIHTLTAMLLAVGSHGEPAASPEVLFDFGTDDVSRWSTVHDTVMGGRSSGTVERTEAGTLVFRGKLSLENNGGFTSFRSDRLDLDIAGSEGLEVRVKGDGRTYIYSCDMRGVPVFGGGYWQEFTTEAGAWTTVRLPWSAFEPYSFGNKMRGQPAMDPERLSAMGVYLYDKKEGPFTLEIDAISAYWPGDPAPAAEAPVFPNDFATLLSLLRITELEDTVAGLDGDFTLFAPSDKAFQALPDGVFQELAKPENLDLLKAVLLYHVVPVRIPAERALRTENASTAEGSFLRFQRDEEGLKVGGARVVATDLEFAGGVVHLIDGVLVPADVQNALAGLPAEPDSPVAGCTTVFALVEAAGLSGALADKERYTLFAPTDEAFAALPAEVVAALLEPENVDALRKVLLHHVVDGGVTAFKATQIAQSVARGETVDVEALDGTALAVGLGEGGLRISGALVARADILLGNAVVHVVDQVLVPADLKLDLKRTPADPVVALLTGVVERGSALFNEGNTAACAEAYRTALESLLLFEQLEGEALRARVEGALERAAGEDSRNASWTLRGAIDAVFSARS